MRVVVQNLRVWLGLAAVLLLSGCIHVPPAATPAQVTALRTALTSMDANIQPAEAAEVAAAAYDYPRELAVQYHLVRPPWWHNFLINVGLKPRGLCFQWTEDLVARLRTLDLQSFDLHWGVARQDTMREHNTVVITAHAKPFNTGIVLDPWRHSGALVWAPVAQDSYPWQEGELDPPAMTPGTETSAARQ